MLLMKYDIYFEIYILFNICIMLKGFFKVIGFGKMLVKKVCFLLLLI